MGTPINISLNDATPTAQVFVPVGRQPNGDFRFTDRTPVSGITTANGWNHVTLGISPPTSVKKLARAKATLSMVNPDYDPDGTDEGSAYTVARISVEPIIPDNFSATARANFRATFESLVASDEFVALIEDLEGVF
jgi:hypothetical protein